MLRHLLAEELEVLGAGQIDGALGEADDLAVLEVVGQGIRLEAIKR
jgi:hypothetical protein